MAIQWLTYSTVTGSICLVAVLALRKLCERYLLPRQVLCFWILPCLRFVFPYSPLKVFSHTYSSFFGKITAENGMQQELLHRLSQPEAADYYVSASHLFSPGRLSLCVYIAGISVFFLVLLYTNLKAAGIVRKGLFLTDRSLLRLVEECKNTLGIKRDIKVRTIPSLQAPALFGLFTPVILLPRHAVFSLKEKQLKYIIFHELIHYKRRDNLVQLVCAAFKILQWFNPLIYYAAAKIDEDMETSCDGEVLALSHTFSGHEYGTTLLYFMQKSSVYKNALSAPLSGRALKRRIQKIALFKGRTKQFPVIFSAAGFLLATIVLFTGATLPGGSSREAGSWVKKIDTGNFFPTGEGAAVLYIPSRHTIYISNKKEAMRRRSPLSTIKIYAALDMLRNDWIRDIHRKKTWDGVIYSYATWNRDHSLRSALEHSVSWFFTNYFTETGTESIKNFLQEIGYGNGLVPPSPLFWMDGSLRISLCEQVELLSRLYTDQLPVSSGNSALVKECMPCYEHNGITLYGKTGSGIDDRGATTGLFIGVAHWDGLKDADNSVYIGVWTHSESHVKTGGTQAKDIAMEILSQKPYRLTKG